MKSVWEAVTLEAVTVLGLCLALGVIVSALLQRLIQLVIWMPCLRTKSKKQCKDSVFQLEPPKSLLLRVDLRSGQVVTLPDPDNLYTFNTGPVTATTKDTDEGDAGAAIKSHPPPSAPMISRRSISHLAASKNSIATQTTWVESCRSSSSSSGSSGGSEVDLLDRSMLISVNQMKDSRTTMEDSQSSTLIDASRDTVFYISRFSDTTYFEETSETDHHKSYSASDLSATPQVDTPDGNTSARKTIELNEMRSQSRGSGSNVSFNPLLALQVIKERSTPQDSDMSSQSSDTPMIAISLQSRTPLLGEESSTSITAPSASNHSQTTSIALSSDGSASADLRDSESGAFFGHNSFVLEMRDKLSELESDRESYYTCGSEMGEDSSSVKDISYNYSP